MEGRIVDILDLEERPLLRCRVTDVRDNLVEAIVLEGTPPEKTTDVKVSTDEGTLQARLQCTDNNKLLLRVLEPFERRAFFRIDDTVQLKARKVPEIRGFAKKLTIPGTCDSHEEATAVDLLKAIDEKLGFLIQHLVLKEEGFFEGHRDCP